MQNAIQFIIDGSLLGGLYTFLALRLAIRFGIVRFINFGHGEMFMLGAYRLCPSLVETCAGSAK